MGLTVLTIEVANPAALDRRTEVESLVDSGAVYSFVPRVVLASLGLVLDAIHRDLKALPMVASGNPFP